MQKSGKQVEVLRGPATVIDEFGSSLSDDPLGNREGEFGRLSHKPGDLHIMYSMLDGVSELL